VIIMTDADVDGAHIRTLLLTFFFRHMREVIEDGCLYIAQPPLFQIRSGKEKLYAYSDAERDAILKKAKTKNPSVQRYKGLGEMTAEQLWDTTMDPQNRILLRVNIEDAVRANEIFDMLMGNNVAPRKKFIETHAKDVKNLDT
jgi:DNA gyrase subunit B